MAMTAASMANRIESYMSAVAPAQGTTNNTAYRLQMLEAMCQGIIDEIKADAVITVTGVQAGGSTAPGTVTA